MQHSASDVQRFRHPGSGRRRGASTPKGRQLDPAALADVQALLAGRPRRRDLLIEHLHLIQDRYHGLSAAHLAALAEEMRLALAEVYEVATFYAHFDIVKEGEATPPAVTVRVCDSLTCALFGAPKLLAEPAGEARSGRARGPRALHGRVRQGAGLRRRPGDVDAATVERVAEAVEHAGHDDRGEARHGFRRLRRGRRLPAAARLPRRPPHARAS